MKHLPHFFGRGQLHTMFFLFPDPNVKAKHHRRRIISPTLLDEYAFVLREGGRIYICLRTFAELFEWMDSCLEAHPLFRRVPAEALADDEVFLITTERTADAQRAARKTPRRQEEQVLLRPHRHRRPGRRAGTRNGKCGGRAL
eukprot:gnl/Ergobibamus_cyprinoides/5671.p3 GENE.gnl/Ergobibamus_cyprinoides/5671~~gnl/Ergobibamus_cyprinoides/5671.p3  ORF type:complete len:143 (+),score=23.41 gnl/Ergobibamus_cyprinoides/5671:234-662(+)